ncbi:MAG: radical SAM protein [Desulfobacterales bacterium]
MNNNKPKVLLTASYGPNELGWGEDMYDLIAARLGRGHGPFQVTSHCHYFALYLLAENITNPTTVLENPHWDEFDRELDEGYDIVGFQLKSLHTTKIARMMKRIREKCPNTKIVIGGYGVSALQTPVPGDTNGDAVYIRENADYLCREEGVRFMRRILGDEPVDREITQYHLPMTGIALAGMNLQVRFPIVLGALGCPNACDFCNTSAFFHHKKIYVAEPEQIYRFVKNYQKRLRSDNFMFILFDEDMFLNREYVLELGRLLRSDRTTWGVRYMTFGSMRSVSKFTAEELRDCGVGSIWIGVESFMCGENLTDDKYAKRQGENIKEMFKDLHRHGIWITGSMVLGFDFHTPENLKEDIDQFVDLKPESYQISPLTPCPGTALYERMTEEGRILDSYEWKDFHLWKDDVMVHKNFKPGEIKEFFDYAHQQIRDKNGPQALQVMENALDSYKLFAEQAKERRKDEYHAFHTRRARAIAVGTSAYLRAVKLNHTSAVVRERAEMLEKRLREEIGPPPFATKVISRYLSRKIKNNGEQPRPPVISDPEPRWSYYNTNGDGLVYVKKGRKAKKPVPYQYKNTIAKSLGRSIASVIRGRI